MIADSDKHTFNAVIVYQLDRFARNRYDSAINKARLKKNGVCIVSARENITDDASGILVEGILESMAEYYSAELSQKIHRGMSLNVQKCLSNVSNPGLGFKVAPDHAFYVDENEAVIVREIFEQYGKGETVTDIIKDLNARQIKISLGVSSTRTVCIAGCATNATSVITSTKGRKDREECLALSATRSLRVQNILKKTKLPRQEAEVRKSMC